MKRAMLTGFALLGAALLSGCPIYPEDRLVCDTSLDCPDGYACSAATGYCYLPSNGNGQSCDEPKDCDFNETCSAKGVCRVGDCSFHGCVSGYTCVVDQGTWTCVTGGSGGTGGDAGTDAASGGSAGSDAASGGSAGSDASAGGSGGSAGSDAASGGSAGSAGSDAASGGSGGGDAASD